MYGKIALNLAIATGSLVAGHFVSLAINGKKNRKTVSNVRLGDWVQWDSKGAFVFPQPREVTNIRHSEHGVYVFVEGSHTGIPSEQCVVMKRTGETSNVNPT